MRNRLLLSIAAAGFGLLAPALSDAQVLVAPAVTSKQSTIVVPATGLDSMQSLDFNAAGGPGASIGQPVVEAIPTPSAFEGGLVVIVGLVAFRVVRKLRAA